MKKRHVLIIGTLFIMGQSFFSYQSIIQNTPLHKKLQEVQSENRYGKIQNRSPDPTVKYVTYQYKKKKFQHIDHQVTLLKQKKQLGSGSTTNQYQLAKIAETLCGQLLIGTKSLREEKISEKEQTSMG